MPGAGFQSFASIDEWMAFLLELNMLSSVPEIVAAKYSRAQKVFLTAWLDDDLIKAGELVALTALELALNDCYGHVVKSRRKQKPTLWSKPPEKAFADLLDHMVTKDGLTDDKLSIVARYGGGVVERLRLDGKVGPKLSEIRNGLAHGAPFDGHPQTGLLELVRDLIHYAYRVK